MSGQSKLVTACVKSIRPWVPNASPRERPISKEIIPMASVGQGQCVRKTWPFLLAPQHTWLTRSGPRMYSARRCDQFRPARTDGLAPLDAIIQACRVHYFPPHRAAPPTHFSFLSSLAWGGHALAIESVHSGNRGPYLLLPKVQTDPGLDPKTCLRIR